MGAPNVIIADAAGLQTQQNELTLSPGSLTVAENVEITRDGVIEVARGFEDFSSNLPDFKPAQLLSIGGVAYAHHDNGLWYYDTASAKWLRKTGDLGTAIKNPNSGVLLNGHLYVTSNSHVVFDYDLSTGERSIIAGRFGASGTANGTGDTARFNTPSGIATDGINLYVCDAANHAIRKVAPPLTAGAAVVTTLAGTIGASGTGDGTGTGAAFNVPAYVTFNGTDLFVTDFLNNTVRRVTTAGVVTTIAGTAGASGGTDATGASARFSGPAGITYLGGALYVADQANGGGTVRKLAAPLTAGAAVVTTIAGTYNNPGSADGTGAAASFNDVQGLDTDGTNLYLADGTNATVRKVAPPLTAGAAVVTTIAGSVGVSAAVDGIGTAANFVFPLGIVAEGGALYVADGQTTSGLLRKLYLDTSYVTTIDGVSDRYGVAAGLPLANGIIAGPD